jgi:hypothetical protein
VIPHPHQAEIYLAPQILIKVMNKIYKVNKINKKMKKYKISPKKSIYQKQKIVY